ncbi:hypothetical protein JOC36_000860 [Weissella uvarum]|uniref:hypothetical protein n=1 Tax=Weissella uvarum TaxID=1479233 RepID=UPI00195F8727|nr:hypothetical protein [Weissella uvarum]MBM7617311.1 hypothetical protein [Weissella uvarum]MCM0595178.1 hypothetical protein [Weissella uvarum]
MQNNRYEDLLIRVEDELAKRGMPATILDTIPLQENSGLAGVTSIKDGKVYIFIDKALSTFEKAETLVEEYFHAISDLGDLLDYQTARAHNNEVNAREGVISFMTSAEDIQRLAQEYPDEPLAPWMLVEAFGYPLDFAQDTLDYYRRSGELK